MAQTPPPNKGVLGFNLTGDFADWTIYTSRERGIVWFSKSPPKIPPSFKQLHQRNRIRVIATAWRKLTQEHRDRWRRAALRARLQLPGYDLFVFWQIKRDPSYIRTIERQTGIPLLEP